MSAPESNGGTPPQKPASVPPGDRLKRLEQQIDFLTLCYEQQGKAIAEMSAGQVEIKTILLELLAELRKAA